MNQIVAIDLETTGLIPTQHNIIQVGISYKTPAGLSTYAIDVDPEKSYRTLIITPEALAVNGFTKDRIAAGQSYNSAEEKLLEFLEYLGPEPLTALGWNVGSFDMQFLRYNMPRLYARFHYRHLELNSIARFLVDCGISPSLEDIKNECQAYATTSLNREKRGGAWSWHDAGIDAWASLCAYEYMQKLLIKVCQ